MNHTDFLTTYETDGKQTRWQISSTSKVKIYQRIDNLVLILKDLKSISVRTLNCPKNVLQTSW